MLRKRMSYAVVEAIWEQCPLCCFSVVCFRNGEIPPWVKLGCSLFEEKDKASCHLSFEAILKLYMERWKKEENRR